MRITQVDAFTATPFAGNPAAVCVLDAPRGDAWMQNVALEMNLSETAFLLREDDAYRLRWFTPVTEVDLCGHATLAAAHVLWEDDHLDAQETARFRTRSGVLTATRDGEWIVLDFPSLPAEAADAPPEVLRALGVEARWTGRSRFDVLVELESEQAVRELAPDIDLIGRADVRGVIVTSRAESSGYDFVSRFFCPAVGVAEDPVTGSAHCTLAPYWAERLGKPELLGYQASARGGVVRVTLSGDRVRLGGQAVTVLRGELLAD